MTLVSSPTATVPGKRNFPLISARGSSSSAEPPTFDNHRRLKSFQNHRQREANLHSDNITAGEKNSYLCEERSSVATNPIAGNIPFGMKLIDSQFKNIKIITIVE